MSNKKGLVWVFLLIFLNSAVNSAKAEEKKTEQDKNVKQLGEVLVTDVAVKDKRLNNPMPRTVVERKEFEDRNNRRAGDILKRMPGVIFGGPPGDNKDVFLLGLDKEFNRIQVDGVQLPDGGEKREFQVNRIPSSLIQEIKILKNPTAEYESDGIAGRIDIKTRPIPKEPFFEGRFGYGGVDGFSQKPEWNEAVAFGMRPFEHFGVMGAFDDLVDDFIKTKKKSDSVLKLENELENRRQHSTNTQWDTALYYGDGSEFHIKPFLYRLDEEKNKNKSVFETAKPAATNESAENEQEDKVQETFGVTLANKLAGDKAKVDSTIGFYRTTEEKEKTNISYKETASVLVLDKRTLDNEDKEDKQWNFASTITLPLESKFKQEAKFGGMVRLKDRFRHKPLKAEINSAGVSTNKVTPKDNYDLSENYYALFGQNQIWFTDRLSILPGLRSEYVRLNSASGAGDEASRDIVDWNPSTHVLYKMRDDMSLRAAVSRAVNRPKFDELSPFEQTEGTKVKIGNPDLEPARSWNFDMGGEFSNGRLYSSLGFFNKEIADVIEEVDTGEDIGGRDVFRFENAGDGWVRGVQIDLKIKPHIERFKALDGLAIWANQTFVRSELQEKSGKKRPFKDQPEFISNLGVDYSFPVIGTTISWSWNYVSERKNVETDKTKFQQPFSTFDLAIKQPLSKNWKLFFEAENLNNAKKVDVEEFTNGTSSHNVEATGRVFWLGAECKF